MQFSRRFVDPTVKLDKLDNRLSFIAFVFCQMKDLIFFSSKHLGILNVEKGLFSSRLASVYER